MSNKYTSVYDWLKYIKANVVGINLRELRLNNMIRYIEANSSTIINKWYMQFGEISYYYDTGTEAYADNHTGWQDNGQHTGSSGSPYSGGSGSHRCA